MSRFELPKGYYFETMPLFGGRGRVHVTDGTSVAEFW